MKHPEKWRETVNPYELPYTNFQLTQVLGYPHAGNDVFHAKGIYRQREVEVFIKVSRQVGADIKREIETLNVLPLNIIPQIIDYDEKKEYFVVTLALAGEKLSVIVGDNSSSKSSFDYLFEYGKTLAMLHTLKGNFSDVKDRRFFHIPNKEYFDTSNLGFVYKFLIENKPKLVNKVFCHGDFHYANILWKDKHISAILDFELSGIGNKEFDIAWALVLRPGQRFLNTKEEIALFLEGYSSIGNFNYEYVKYYIVLIYSYFYHFRGNEHEYTEYIMGVFNEYCTNNESVS